MRHWPRPLACLALGTLVCGVACAAPPKPHPATPVQPAAKAHKPAKPESADARTAALIAFQRDLVSVLAPQVSAGPLLAAALLARPLPRQPAFNGFHALIQRSLAASDASAADDWAALADCDAKADACPNAAALKALEAKAPDNAAVWLFKLGVDAHDDHAKDARADLARAAQAKLYDDYTGAALQALANNISLLPPPPTTMAPLSGGGAAGVQLMMVFGNAGSMPQVYLPATAQLCESGDAAIKAECRTLGQLLEWGSSPLSRSLGLHLREVLDPDPARQADAKNARRSLIWQVQSFSRLQASAQGDPALGQHLLALARNGGTEMSLMLAALHDYHLPSDPPADWQPDSGH